MIINTEHFDPNDIYIDSLNDGKEIKKSNSWADIVDCELSDNLENKLLSSTFIESKKDNKVIKNVSYNISDIIIKNPELIDDITLLEYQTYLSSHIKKYVKNHIDDCLNNEKNEELDFELHYPKFEWLASASKHLSNKLELVINNDIKSYQKSFNNDIIPRSSYKFCEYNYECQFNKNNNLKGCFAQHYVHNIVYNDIIIIIDYLKYVKKNNKKINYNELFKCITTVSYVLKHMYEELLNSYTLSDINNNDGNYDLEKINMLHIERSQNYISECKKKKKIKKNNYDNKKSRNKPKYKSKLSYQKSKHD